MKISKKISIIFILLFIFTIKMDVVNAKENYPKNMLNNVNVFKDSSSFIAKSKKKATTTKTTKKKSSTKKKSNTIKGETTKLEIENNTYTITCDDVKILHDIWSIIIILAPVLVILMGILDFGRAVVTSKEEEMQKSWKKFPKRLLAVALLFLVPLLISVILSLTVDENVRDKNLMYCIINGGE